eukprot:6185692-Pleurochrysis_carterae.AAC.2
MRASAGASEPSSRGGAESDIACLRVRVAETAWFSHSKRASTPGRRASRAAARAARALPSETRGAVARRRCRSCTSP